MEKELSLLLDAAKEIGGAAWPILVKQAWVDGVLGLSLGVCLLLVLAAMIAVIAKYHEKMDDEDFVFGFAFVMGMLLLCAGLTISASSIDNIIYPEGTALERVINRAR